MKRTVLAIAAATALAGCSTTTGATGPGGQQPAKSGKAVDVCSLLPASQVAESVGVRIDQAQPTDGGGSGCSYSGTEQRGPYKVEVRYTPDGWIDTETGADPVTGVGDKARYNNIGGAQLAVKAGADLLTVEMPEALVSDAEGATVKVAKALLGKL